MKKTANNNTTTNKQPFSKNRFFESKIVQFRNLVSYGYSDDSFTNASKLFQEIQKSLSLIEVKKLGEAWRDVYVDEKTIPEFQNLCDSLVS